jgi:hypothetical protein
MKKLFLLLTILLVVPSLAYAGPVGIAGAVSVGAGASYTYTSTGFGGSSRVTQGSNLTGIVDGKTFLFSAWIKLTNAGENGTTRCILSAYDGGTNRRVFVGLQTDNTLIIALRNSSSTAIYTTTTTGTFTASSGWFHVLASADLANSKCYTYINGSSDASCNVVNNDTIAYSIAEGSPRWDINGVEDNSYRFTGLLSEYYFTTEYLDLSVSGNRLKFRSAGGKPVSLGANGSTPTGTQPLIYLKNSYSTFQTNLGSGGNFTVNGSSLTDGGADIP